MKNFKVNIYLMAGIIFIVAMTTLAGSDVGTVSTRACGEPFSWHLPFTMFALVAFPFVLGILGERTRND